MHDARPVAVRLDIRPRLQLAAEPRIAARRGFRLPALAVPAAGYWLFMAALTYFFAHLGPHPLEAFTSEPAARAEPPQPMSPASPREPQPAPAPAPTNVADVAPPVAAASEATPEPEAQAQPQPSPTAWAAAESEQEPERAGVRVTSRRAAALASPDEPKGEPTPVAQRPLARAEEPAPLAFPDFTDTSPASRRARAADGPRIDSVFDPAPEQPAPSPPEGSAPERGRQAPVAVTSCEAAIAHNNEQLEIGGPRRPADITREAYANILQNGRYLAGCRVPDRTVIEVCAAVRDGRAVGVTVVSNPPRAALDACVRSAVASLAFPKNERLDVTHTRFDAVSR
jgi:hypothetical protein